PDRLIVVLYGAIVLALSVIAETSVVEADCKFGIESGRLAIIVNGVIVVAVAGVSVTSCVVNDPQTPRRLLAGLDDSRTCIEHLFDGRPFTGETSAARLGLLGMERPWQHRDYCRRQRQRHEDAHSCITRLDHSFIVKDDRHL